MTEEIRNKILNTISEIQTLDLQECLSKTLPPNQSLEDKKIWSFNGISIIPIIERAVKQMEAFLNNDDYVFYNSSVPSQSSIENYFSSFLASLKTGNVANISTALQGIVNYQIYYGFWDRGNINLFDVNEVDVAKKKSELSTLLSRINKVKKNLETRLTQIDEEITKKKKMLA